MEPEAMNKKVITYFTKILNKQTFNERKIAQVKSSCTVDNLYCIIPFIENK